MIKKWKSWFGVLLSLWVALLPSLGFPRGMKDIFYTISGLVLMVIFFMLAHDKTKAER